MININRRKEVPESLKKENPKAYRNLDVLEALTEDFYSKCYLTEEKYFSVDAIPIDHFLTRNEAPHLKYEWTNLYPISYNANSIRPKSTPEGGYLDPCNPEDDVENDIIYDIISPNTMNFKPQNESNIKALNTVELLKRVHNGHDEKTKRKTADLRDNIYKKSKHVESRILRWKASQDLSDEKEQLANEIKHLLSRKSSYSMLCRSLPIVKNNIPDSFLD